MDSNVKMHDLIIVYSENNEKSTEDKSAIDYNQMITN